MEQRLSIVTLAAVDLDKVRCFYDNGRGWNRERKEDSIVFSNLPAPFSSCDHAPSLLQTPASTTGAPT